MHLDAERMERLLDGELAPELVRSTREHLAACDDCRTRVRLAEESKGRIDALLQQLDHSIPPADIEAVIVSAERREGSPLRWAAVIVFALALGGIAYAAPVTGLRAFLQSLWHRPAVQVQPTPDSMAAPVGGAVPPATAGIAVRPGSRLVVEVIPTVRGASARVVLGEGEEVAVRSPAGAATFSSDANRLLVDVLQPATLDIEIPRSAPHVEIRVSGRRVFLSQSSRITAPTGSASAESWLLPLDRVP